MTSREEAGPSPGRLTPYVLLDDVLTGYAGTVRDVLGNRFVGLYLIGSLAVGDFDLTSDVDFMVVTTDDLTGEDVDRLQTAHRSWTVRESRWVRHLEFSFFPLPVLHATSSPYLADGRRNDDPSRLLWYVDNGSDTIERSDHDNTLVSRWTLRECGRAVLGPEPATFAPTVTADELRREIRSSMLGWERLVLQDPSPFDNRFHQVFLVLNNCRALQDLHEGRITSKKQGAAWAKRHLDEEWHAFVDRCWEERADTGIHVSQPADPEAFRRTVVFMTYTARLAEAFPLP